MPATFTTARVAPKFDPIPPLPCFDRPEAVFDNQTGRLLCAHCTATLVNVDAGKWRHPRETKPEKEQA